MISYRNRAGLAVTDLWFNEGPVPPGTDIAKYYCWSEPIPEASVEPFHSLQSPLTLTDEELLKRMASDTSYEIRRAAKDPLRFEALQATEQSVADFVAFYEPFAQSRALDPVNPVLLNRYAAAGHLAFTQVWNTELNELWTWHVYYRDPKRVLLWHSATRMTDGLPSNTRRALSRANRYHHWLDFGHYRKEAIEVYDWGGWYAGSDDEKLLGVNRFKESFGGEKVLTYQGTAGVSLAGRLYLKVRPGS